MIQKKKENTTKLLSSYQHTSRFRLQLWQFIVEHIMIIINEACATIQCIVEILYIVHVPKTATISRYIYTSRSTAAITTRM